EGLDAGRLTQRRDPPTGCIVEFIEAFADVRLSALSQCLVVAHSSRTWRITGNDMCSLGDERSQLHSAKRDGPVAHQLNKIDSRVTIARDLV
ncbi:hypothetical protein, partial [Bosea sp. Leaf344]|uniref:hypothetical protein n=1 Tax=Bosea sp. Leaf344 TaxID=1736346 RepID=UPI001AEC509D